MIAFDATFLLYLVRDPGTVETPLDSTGERVEFAKERVAGLVADLQKSGTKIVIGTPALAEVMVRAGVEASQRYLAIMKRAAVFRIIPFDERAAIETAMMHGHDLQGERGHGSTPGTHAKLKYDRQIVAIAKVEGVHTLYTDDVGQRRFAEQHGLAVRGLADCLVPSAEAQGDLFNQETDDGENEED